MGILDGTYDGARDARAAAYVRKQEEKSFRGLLKLFNRACDATGRPRYEELSSPRPFQSAAMPPSSMVKSSDFEEATPVSHHLARSDASPMIITPPPGLGWDTEVRVSVTPELARTARRRQLSVTNQGILATPTVRCSTEAKEFKKREAEERRTPGGVAYSYEQPPGDMLNEKEEDATTEVDSQIEVLDLDPMITKARAFCLWQIQTRGRTFRRLSGKTVQTSNPIYLLNRLVCPLLHLGRTHKNDHAIVQI